MKYFDFAATCPLDQEAAAAYVKAATEFFGNSQSLHDIGGNAASLLEHCRLTLAKLLGVYSEGIYFTSGGSESNFLTLQNLLSLRQKSGNHIISSMAEHTSIHSTIELLKQNGYKVTLLPLNKEGEINVSQLLEVIQEDTVLISIQHCNSEIGTIQPLLEIRDICNREGILLHSDLVQSFGKLDIKEVSSVVDSFSLSAHKIYGPKGVGIAYLNPKNGWKSYYPSTTHEKGFRPGTIDVPGIVAMTIAAEKAISHLNKHTEHYQMLRNLFLEQLKPQNEKFIIYGTNDPFKQNLSIVGLRIKGIEGQWVMLECNRKGYAISTGSACQVGSMNPSKTMVALGVYEKEAKEFIRVSFGRDTSKEDVVGLAQTLLELASSS
ncbi:IscS subfamily cysteine desulfurase [Cytobacillus spongiae]|jgi:cysteine desulfurase|uniref:IscS subfamily cysteine desulfurase n=1 Tax=Cytobacillus spongiae TaxID=2901381 RepID=UPI001F3B5B7C|nr:IscS subfamily cysteine desulfurase [Cytobacillus spongiae]UII55025.1 IscS subfamily cysteine desulfurase [Cytobacillus spongiae]